MHAFQSLPARLALGAVALLIAAPAASQDLPKRKAGLWEIQVTHGGDLAELQKQARQKMQAAMAGMNPEQRRLMEQMMAGRGIATPGAAGAPQVHRFCLTPAQAARELDARPDPGQRCSQKITPVSASEARFTVTCDGPDGKSSGEGRVWDLSPNGYRMQMTMTMQGKGAPGSQKMEMSHEARWLGADCKGVAPLPD